MSKYVTQEEATKAAKKSTKAAIKCSIKHWNQLLKAHKRDFSTFNNGKTVWPSAKFCALCHRFWGRNADYCRNDCPLSLVGENCFPGNSIYQKALTNCTLWNNNVIKRKPFTNSCKEMIKVLESLLGENYVS